jgi:putative salt-induced outer membrane protein YdiY
MFKKYPGPILAILLLLGLCAVPAVAAKTDVVVLVNGNAVTGEVKSLEFGLLKYSTDSMGTVSIDWEDIVSVSSQNFHQVELPDGTRYYGQLIPTGDPQTVRIVTASDEYVLSNSEIVRITPIEANAKFIERLDGSFSFGLQTQKSSEITTSNLSADISYRSRAYLLGVRANSSITNQPTEPKVRARQSINFNYQRFRDNRWFTDWFTGWEKNDELGIDQRTSIGGALGHFFVQTNKHQFSVALGAQASETAFLSDEENATDVEGRIEIRYLKRNLAPETSFRITYTLYPLLEDLSQYRAESDMSLRRELLEDLFLDFTVGYSYISNPTEGAETTDYTATTSIGYSF